ncbi:hypothetical protein WMZ97_21930 [Lentibacillus sp. N15]
MIAEKNKLPFKLKVAILEKNCDPYGEIGPFSCGINGNEYVLLHCCKEGALMRNVRDAAAISLAIVIIKLALRLIPPAKGFVNLFEDGIWLGMGIILTSYIVIFIVVFLILVVIRRRKKKDVEGK